MIEIHLVNGEKITMNSDLPDRKNYDEFMFQINDENDVIEIDTTEYGVDKYYVIPKSKIMYLVQSENEKERKEKEKRLKELADSENFSKKMK